MKNHLPSGHRKIAQDRNGNPKCGVMIVNLGTPDDVSTPSIRRYLREFLWDRRVVEVPRLVWFFVLHCIILVFRPKKTAATYKKIWMDHPDGSPLRYYTRLQGEGLARHLTAMHGDSVVTTWAMRYGQPSIRQNIHMLKAQGCQRLVVLPLYPQYSATTTASVADEVFSVLSSLRWQPMLRMADPYHDHPRYIEALKTSVEEHLQQLDWEPDAIVASFHGIPQDYFDKGDPYYCFCHKTARLLREALGKSEDNFRMTFQSRFGPREWLKPYTDDVLAQLAASGKTKVVVLTPGFAADCIETLEEIAMESKHAFEAAGGTAFSVVPCLNERNDHLELMATLVHEAAGSWLPDQSC